MVILNIGMAVSAISRGSHYFVDILAGIGIAILIVAVLKACILGRIAGLGRYPAPHPVR